MEAGSTDANRPGALCFPTERPYGRKGRAEQAAQRVRACCILIESMPLAIRPLLWGREGLGGRTDGGAYRMHHRSLVSSDRAAPPPLSSPQGGRRCDGLG